MKKRTGKVNKSETKKIKFSTKETIGAVVGIILMLLFGRSKDSIINYPSFVGYSVYGIVAFIFVLLASGTIKFDSKIKDIEELKTFPIGYNIFIGVFWAIPATFILLVPFNYYIISSTNKSQAQKEYLKIDGISRNPKGKRGLIEYTFKGTKNFIHVNYSEVEKYISRGDNYRLVLRMHPAALGSYIFDSWDIVDKSSSPDSLSR